MKNISIVVKAGQAKAFEDILKERNNQDIKWGEQNHNPYIYLTILLEETGELSQSILHSQFGGDKDKNRGGFKNVRKEAVHVAATAMAIVECLDRNKWVSNDVNLVSLKDDIEYGQN